MTSHQVNCLICGAELEYGADMHPVTCVLCGKKSEANVTCARGHYVCDACHSLPSGEFIYLFTVASDSVNPVEMALSLMRDARVNMHGPEHHFLVPAVLLAAYYNAIGEKEKKAEKIRIAQKRALQVPGGFCGSHGDCGAAVGIGTFVSVMTGATPLSNKDWKLSNLATAKALLTIAENGGPRCCKRNTFLALHSGVKFIQEQFGVTLPLDDAMICEFTDINRECIKIRCPFYKKVSR